MQEESGLLYTMLNSYSTPRKYKQFLQPVGQYLPSIWHDQENKCGSQKAVGR